MPSLLSFTALCLIGPEQEAQGISQLAPRESMLQEGNMRPTMRLTDAQAPLDFTVIGCCIFQTRLKQQWAWMLHILSHLIRIHCLPNVWERCPGKFPTKICSNGGELSAL